MSSVFLDQELFVVLDIDPNQQYIPVRPILQYFGLAPRSYEQALRRHAVLSSGTKAMWIRNEQQQPIPALCLRVDLLPLWLSTLPSKPGSILARWQDEVATALWQQFKPSGASTVDAHVSERYQHSAIEQAYTQAQEIASLARQQLFAERELERMSAQSTQPDTITLADPQTHALVTAIRATAQLSATLSKRNDYLAIFMGLVRVFQLTSMRQLSRHRLEGALAWLAHWRNEDDSDNGASSA